MSVHSVTCWYSRSGFDSFWLRLAAKGAMATLVLLAIRVLCAQQATPPAAGGAGAIPEGTDAKGYKVWMPYEPLAKDQKRLREIQDDVKKVQSGALSLAEKQGQFSAYFKMYYFPLQTQTGDKDLKNLADERTKFFRELELARPEPHKVMVDLALAAYPTVVRDDKFHPAVRYNAMAVISNLNDLEPSKAAASPAPPVPMARALKFIFDEFKRPENPDSIRMAALLGLARHLEWENEKPQGLPQIPADVRRDITKELLALAQTDEAPAGHSADGHVWFRRRAVETLGYACLRKPDAEVTDALGVLLKDEKQPVALRCTVAATLGKIALQAPATIDALATAKELGYLALAACDIELTRVTSLKKDEEEHLIRLQGQVPDPNSGQAIPVGPRAGLIAGATPGGGMPGGAGGYMPTPGGAGGAMGSADGGYGAVGMMDPSMQDPKAYRFDHTRRRIRQQLYCVQLGLTGGEDRVEKKGGPPAKTTTTAAGGAEPRGMWVMAKVGPDKDAVNDIYGKVRKLVEVVEVKAVDIPMLDKELRKEMKNVEVAIGRTYVPPPDPKELLKEEPVVTPPADKKGLPKAKGPKKGPVPGKKLPAKPPGKPGGS